MEPLYVVLKNKIVKWVSMFLCFFDFLFPLLCNSHFAVNINSYTTVMYVT